MTLLLCLVSTICLKFEATNRSQILDQILGQIIGATPGAMNAIWSFLPSLISLLKIIATPVASDASWVASLSDLVDSIRNLQKHLEQDDG